MQNITPENYQQLNLSPETLAIRLSQQRSIYGEHSEALYLTSSFLFDEHTIALRTKKAVIHILGRIIQQSPTLPTN